MSRSAFHTKVLNFMIRPIVHLEASCPTKRASLRFINTVNFVQTSMSLVIDHIVLMDYGLKIIFATK